MIFDPFLDTKIVEIKGYKVVHIYPTPLRNGKVLLYYNITDNSLLFSRNRVETKYAEDDF